MVQVRSSKLGSPNGMAMMGITMSSVNDTVRAVKAAPMMKPTAMSIRFPLVRKSRNS